jgi:hypothetical protein
MNELKITEEKYQEILNQHKNGELVVFIDTASFRQLFTENKVKKINELLGISIAKESLIISLIFYTIPVFLIMMGVFAILGFHWWSILALPTFLLIWVFVHSKSSIGIQKINGSIIFLVISIFLSIVFFKDVNIFIKLSIIVFAFQIFYSKLLYFLSSKFAFRLLFKHYKFFAFCYEKKLKNNQFVPLVWIDTKKNYDAQNLVMKKHGI